MHRAHYWLLLQIAKMPKVFTYGSGLLIGLALLLTTAVTVLWTDKSRLAEQHDHALQAAQAIVEESDELLKHLVAHSDLGCDATSLIHLNAHLLQSKFIREIGQLDDDNRLICSSALGILEQPIKGNYPFVTTQSGRTVFNNVPLQMADETLGATLIQYKNFNVVLSPYFTQEINDSADVVWLRTTTGLALLNSTLSPKENAHLRARLKGIKETTVIHQLTGYNLITTHPDADLLLQTRRTLKDIAQQNSVLLAIMLTGSLLIAALAVGTLAPYIKKLGRVENRIPYLCDNEHILLLYQPVFDLASLRPIGCEVLMRMQENSDGILMPDQVIPTILACGLARQVDHIVSRKAIREVFGSLPPQETQFKIALNYFPESIDHTELGPLLKQAQQAQPRDDIYLCLEVTEHSVSTDLVKDVNALRAQGFKIAVDDFGTGYSNLKTVTQLSPDILKIDKTFVYELEDATVRANLIREITNIARAINAIAIAEGIASTEQAALLAALGVQYGQGTALAPPMELDAFLSFMQKFQ